MNVASASAIILYELWKARTSTGEGVYVEEADVKARERLLGLFDVLIVKGELPKHKRRLASKAFKKHYF